MLIQVCNTVINTEQVNYAFEFKSIADDKEKVKVVFINEDFVILPLSLEDFIKTVNFRALACRVRDVELKDVEPRQDVNKK